jgi:small subunit ribosomal protein S16
LEKKMRDWSKIIPIFPSVTGAEVRLRKIGCWNRPFFQIGVCPRARRQDLPFNEIIGSYDPMPNERGEKLVSLDMERFSYWLGQGAHLTPGIKDLLGEDLFSHDADHHDHVI